MVDHLETVRVARTQADDLRAKVEAGEITTGQAATAALMAAHSLGGDLLGDKRALAWMSDTLRRWRKDKRR